jgi:hypothetical protein
MHLFKELRLLSVDFRLFEVYFHLSQVNFRLFCVDDHLFQADCRLPFLFLTNRDSLIFIVLAY